MKTIEVDVFCDEIKESSLPGPDGQNEKWIYIGFLYVPVHQKLSVFNDLMERRCKLRNNWQECKLNCDFHLKNGKEI